MNRKLVLKITAITVMAALLLLSAVGLTGCRGVVKGSDELETKTFDINNFTMLEIAHTFDAEVEQSTFYSVVVTANDNIFKYVEVVKTGDRLRVDLKPDYAFTNLDLSVKITMPELNSITVSGASRATVEGFSGAKDLIAEVSGASMLDLVGIRAADLEFNVSGASTIIGSIYANGADFEVSGASKVQLSGSGADLEADVSGASRIELSAFTVDNATVALSGASKGTIKLDGILNVDLSGLSRLSYIGNPTFGDIDVASGSHFTKE